MDNVISTLFSVALFPFTSHTFFLQIPAMMVFVISLMLLVMRLLKGDF